MTNEEAMVFMDNLIICIKEHPILADWLVEIENRKTEPSDSEKPNNCETCLYRSAPWDAPICDSCTMADSHYEKDEFAPKTEPQIIACPIQDNEAWTYEDYQRGIAYAWSVAQKVFGSTVTFYEAEDVAKQIAMDEPQAELVNDSQILVKDLVDDEFNPYDEECRRCKHLKLKCEFIPTYCKFESRDEPQTETSTNEEKVQLTDCAGGKG